MAYTTKFLVAAGVLFLAVTITPQLTEAQNHTHTACASMSPVEEHCASALDSTPSKECCNDLKTANKTVVDCVCSNYLLNTSINNDTRAAYYRITVGCNVLDKYLCGGELKKVNGGATIKIGASMGLVVLVTNLLFLIH